MIALGLMSGTSLDGLDIALCDITGSDLDTKVTMLDFDSIDMPTNLKNKILKVSHPDTARVDDITSLNMEIGRWYADSIEAFLNKINFNDQIDFIASHGQTIYHIPTDTKNHIASTLQIGDPSFMAQYAKCPVVYNFRTADIAVGGEGAPLVPFTDYVLYGNDKRSIILQNIGGIGNLTFIKKNPTIDQVIAFDTGPGNMMINAATDYYYDEAYDKDGTYAHQGVLIEEVFSQLKDNPYFKQEPPKSTGREMFGEDRLHVLLKKYKNQPNDMIYTLTRFSAWTIYQSYRDFIFPEYDVDEIVISGGGAYNPVLMDEIQSFLPDYNIKTQEDLNLSSDAKEAIAFVILGNQTLLGKGSNVPTATGADKFTILGQICPKPIIE